MVVARWHFGIYLCLAQIIFAGCRANNLLTRITVEPSPHERYAAALRSADLHQTALGGDWLRVGDQALLKPLSMPSPFTETGYFPADRATAVAYQVELKRGRRLSVEITHDNSQSSRLFVDLFEVRVSQSPERVASLTEGPTLTYDAVRDGAYLLRVQPELLRSGRYTVTTRSLASVMFPVQGLNGAAVQSEFGAGRDAGRREHEGIDIFAARNTPVLAVADGIANSDTNNLGGNVVWLRASAARRSFYYAHLQRAALEGSATVRAGDVVGYVGNSGNAKTTSPHLHFGIYEGGAIDPFPFIQADDAVPPAPRGDLSRLGELVRVTSARVALRSGTNRSAPTNAQLTRATVGRAFGLSGSAVRVTMPDGAVGYLDNASVTTATTRLRTRRLPKGTIVHEQPLENAPIVETLAADGTADVLGEFGGFDLVRSEQLSGWIRQVVP